MPKVGVKQDVKRRAKSATKASARPKRKPRVSRKSPLAEYLADPTPVKKARLMQIAQRGEIGLADIQAAIAQELSGLVDLEAKEPRLINALRPVYVLRHRLLKDLQEVILRSQDQPARDYEAVWKVTVIVQGVAGDRGDQVRTKAPPESEWPR